VVDVVADAGQVLQHLDVESCLVLGWSGGGAHALACAARLPQATAAAVIASGAPVSAQGLDWFAGMREGNVEGFMAAIEGESSLRPLLERELPDMLPGSAEELARVMAEGAAEVDRAYLSGELVEDFLAGNRAALRAGVDGWCDDALALANDWGFEVGEITIPTMVWHGGADVFAPFAHGQWLAGRIRQARAHLFPDEGHFSIGVGRMGEILDALIGAG
jgi:pimeloyl-ACP methyl ester carboxylesterase